MTILILFLVLVRVDMYRFYSNKRSFITNTYKKLSLASSSSPPSPPSPPSTSNQDDDNDKIIISNDFIAKHNNKASLDFIIHIESFAPHAYVFSKTNNLGQREYDQLSVERDNTIEETLRKWIERSVEEIKPPNPLNEYTISYTLGKFQFKATRIALHIYLQREPDMVVFSRVKPTVQACDILINMLKNGVPNTIRGVTVSSVTESKLNELRKIIIATNNKTNTKNNVRIYTGAWDDYGTEYLFESNNDDEFLDDAYL